MTSMGASRLVHSRMARWHLHCESVRAARGGVRVSNARVAIIMGSQNDWETMRPAAEALEQTGRSLEASGIPPLVRD